MYVWYFSFTVSHNILYLLYLCIYDRVRVLQTIPYYPTYIGCWARESARGAPSWARSTTANCRRCPWQARQAYGTYMSVWVSVCTQLLTFLSVMMSETSVNVLHWASHSRVRIMPNYTIPYLTLLYVETDAPVDSRLYSQSQGLTSGFNPDVSGW